MSVLGLADQYSLGCVLYECLTGRVPFEKDLDASIIFAHVEERPWHTNPPSTVADHKNWLGKLGSDPVA